MKTKLRQAPAASGATSSSPNFRKSFIWNLVGTTVAAFLSLFLMIIVTRRNGIAEAGIFTFAFSAATVFQAISTYSGRTFQITDKDKRTTDSDYFYLKGVTCLATLLIVLGFSIIRGYTDNALYLLLLLSIYRLLESFSESTYAVLQKSDRLYQVGRSIFIKALLSVLLFLAVDLLTGNLVWSCFCIILAHLATIIIYDLPRLRHADFRFRALRVDRIWFLLRIGFFTFGFSFLSLYIINSAKYAIDAVGSPDDQTIYGIIAMPATMLILFGQYVIQPFLTTLKKYLATDFTQFRKLTLKLTLFVLGFGALALIAAFFLGIPVLELLYAVDLDPHLLNLMIIIIGGIAYSVVTILSTSLITMRRTADQFTAYAIAGLCALIIARPLVASLGVTGACLTYLISMSLLLGLYIGIFCFRSREFIHRPQEGIAHVKSE